MATKPTINLPLWGTSKNDTYFVEPSGAYADYRLYGYVKDELGNPQKPLMELYNWNSYAYGEWLEYFETFTDELNSNKFDKAGGVITGDTAITKNAPIFRINTTNSVAPILAFQSNGANKSKIEYSISDTALKLENTTSSESVRLLDGSGLVFNNGSANFKIWHENNDGHSSGLDADTVDGIQGNTIVVTSGNQTIGGVKSFSNGIELLANSTINNNIPLRARDSLGIAKDVFRVNTSNMLNIGDSTISTRVTSLNNPIYNDGSNDFVFWTAKNMGGGSTLDADFLDGQHGTYYLNASNINSGTLNELRLPSSIAASRIGSLTASKVAISTSGGTLSASSLDASRLLHLANVSSDIQAQLNSKQNVITGGATTIVSSNLTASRVLTSDSNGKVAVSSVSATELEYLSGLRSNVQNQLDSFGVVGQVIWKASNNTPSGHLKCNGAAVSRTTYAALFAEIGTTYGAGNGSTTFNLPDLRGVFVRGLDEGRGLDAGRTLGSYQDDYTPNVNKSITIDADDNVNRIYPILDTELGETRPKNIALVAYIKF